jgi:drug/metabolite transporter (DMT)-like permease
MQDSTTRGIVSMIAAVLCFSLMDASLKQLSAFYPPLQVAFFRGVSALPLLLVLALWRREQSLWPRRPGLHVARGLLSVATLSAFIYAVSLLSLADAYSIFLIAPLFVTALSVPILRENVGWRRWIAIAVGMIGAIIILRPSGLGLVTLGGVAALISAFCYALGIVLIRVATRTDSALATVFWTLLVVSVVAGVLSLRVWVDVRDADFIWIAAIAVTGTAGQLLLTDALRRCAAAIVAPFEYSALIWGIALDFTLWHVLPAQRMLVGASIVVGSGLYVIYRERKAASLVVLGATSASTSRVPPPGVSEI